MHQKETVKMEQQIFASFLLPLFTIFSALLEGAQEIVTAVASDEFLACLGFLLGFFLVVLAATRFTITKYRGDCYQSLEWFSVKHRVRDAISMDRWRAACAADRMDSVAVASPLRSLKLSLENWGRVAHKHEEFPHQGPLGITAMFKASLHQGPVGRATTAAVRRPRPAYNHDLFVTVLCANVSLPTRDIAEAFAGHSLRGPVTEALLSKNPRVARRARKLFWGNTWRTACDVLTAEQRLVVYRYALALNGN